MIDLSKAKAGDTVHFRCGGQAVIKDVVVVHPAGSMNSYRNKIHFEGDTYPDEKLYQDCGTRKGTSVTTRFDIISITPKPFDWKEVKAGMAFYTNPKDIEYFVGMHPITNNPVMTNGEGSNAYGYGYEHQLKRAPEHDVTVKS